MITSINEFKTILNYSEEIQYHLLNGINICENIMRPGSQVFEGMIKEARTLWSSGFSNFSQHDTTLFTSTDIGLTSLYEGKEVMLDLPYENLDLVSEAEYKGREVELNKPKRGGSKKYYVYVKNDKGNVIKIQFGDAGGLNAKVSDPEARKRFAARHKCSEKKDKTTAGYWACRINRYGYLWGGKTYPGYW